MDKALKAGFISIVLAVFVNALTPLAAEGQRNGPLGDALSRMDALNKVLVSLKADVRMEKTNKQLGESDVYTGTTSYIPKTAKKPMRARLDWTKPTEEWLAINGDSYELYRPRLKQYYRGNVKSAMKGSKVPASVFAFMSMSRKQLNDNYTVNYIGQDGVGAKQTYHLELMPKVKTDYKSAELWVDSDGMPIQSRIIAKNGDTTTILLSNVQKNVKVDTAVFKLKIPAGIVPLEG